MLAIYCRTSKIKEDGKDYSIESQQQGGLKLAQQLGIDFKYYIDEGISGTLDIEVREAFADMMSDIKKEEVTVVYCIDQSRIERNTNTWRFFVAECINNKCKYYPDGREFDLTDADNMLFANLLSLVNSYYAEITSKKVKIANYNKAKKGKTHGLKAYGYMRDADNNYKVVEEEAVNVRRMFELSLQGIGTYTIANIFNKEAIPTKFNQFKGRITRKDKYTKRKTYFEKSNVLWRGNVIHDMLKNEIYKGIRVWKDLRIELKNQIVSNELWDKVNNNLSKNKKNVGRNIQYNYLLNGLINCSICQNEIIGKKRLKGSDNAYKCKGKRPSYKNCENSRGISLPKLETFIIHHLFYSKELKSMLSKAPKNGTETLQLRKQRTQKENNKAEIKRGVERLAKILRDKDLADDDNFLQSYKDYKLKLTQVSTEIEDLTIRISEIENDVRNKRTKSIIESYTEAVGFSEIKKMVHSLIEKIELYHQKLEKSGYFILRIKYKYYDETSTFITDWQAMKWRWVSHNKNQALTQNDLQDDRDLLNYFLKRKKVTVKTKFKGFETNTIKHDIIQLHNEELIQFD